MLLPVPVPIAVSLTFVYLDNAMRRLNPRWLDVLLGGAFGGTAAWFTCHILATGKFEYRYWGSHPIFTPQNEPSWYWVWVAIWSGTALFFLFHSVRALLEIIRVHQMDKDIEDREHLITKSVSIKIVGEDGTEREYHSIDDVPSEFRSEIEALEKEADKASGHSSVTKVSQTDDTITTETVTRKDATGYKIVDESGAERIYHSLDEMPAEFREAIEEAQKNQSQSPPNNG